MEIEVEKVNNITIIKVRGNINNANANDLGQLLENEINIGASKLILLIDQVPYISSVGLRVLVATLKHLLNTHQNSRDSMVFVEPSQRVREVFEMSKLDSIFVVFDSVADAIRHFTGDNNT